MKLLHVVPSYLPALRYGGPIQAVHGLARAQAAAGHSVTVFTTDADGNERLKVPSGQSVDRDGVAVYYFRREWPKRLFRSPTLARALRQRIDEFDLAHLHSVFLLPTFYAARHAERRNVPYLVSPRGMLVGELMALRGGLRKRLWIALFERRTLAQARAVIVSSGPEERELRELGLDLAPVAVVPNGIDAAPASSLSPSRSRFFLFLGRLTAKKRVDLILKALAEMRSARLVVAGGDDEGLRAGLEALSRRLGVADRVEFVGEVTGLEKQNLLARSFALILPSRSENFGNVVLESLAVGRPAIVTAAVGAAEHVARCGAGLVIEASPQALATAMRSLLRSPEESDAMGERGRQYASTELNWRRVAELMDAEYVRSLSVGAGE